MLKVEKINEGRRIGYTPNNKKSNKYNLQKAYEYISVKNVSVDDKKISITTDMTYLYPNNSEGSELAREELLNTYRQRITMFKQINKPQLVKSGIFTGGIVLANIGISAFIPEITPITAVASAGLVVGVFGKPLLDLIQNKKEEKMAEIYSKSIDNDFWYPEKLSFKEIKRKTHKSR